MQHQGSVNCGKDRHPKDVEVFNTRNDNKKQCWTQCGCVSTDEKFVVQLKIGTIQGAFHPREVLPHQALIKMSAIFPLWCVPGTHAPKHVLLAQLCSARKKDIAQQGCLSPSRPCGRCIIVAGSISGGGGLPLGQWLATLQQQRRRYDDGLTVVFGLGGISKFNNSISSEANYHLSQWLTTVNGSWRYTPNSWWVIHGVQNT